MSDKEIYTLALDIERRLTLSLARLSEADRLLSRVCDWLPTNCPERVQLRRDIIEAMKRQYAPKTAKEDA